MALNKISTIDIGKIALVMASNAGILIGTVFLIKSGSDQLLMVFPALLILASLKWIVVYYKLWSFNPHSMPIESDEEKARMIINGDVVCTKEETQRLFSKGLIPENILTRFD
jgi:hypothetical protein